MLHVFDGFHGMVARAKRRFSGRTRLGVQREEGETSLTHAEHRVVKSMHPAFRRAFERTCTEGRASYAYVRCQFEEHLSLVRARSYEEAGEVGQLIANLDESLAFPLTQKLATGTSVSSVGGAKAG